MPLKTFKRSIILSVLFHTAVLALIIWGASLFYSVKFERPGEGDTIGVWLAAGGETIGGGQKKASPPPLSHQGRGDDSPSVTGQKDSQTCSGPNCSVTGGSGEGETGGDGVGKGNSGKGNPVLAAIWKKINASKYYPAQAKKMGLKGDPQVVFYITEDGHVRDVKISRSCGKEVLDEAALETVKRAAPLPYFAGPITVTIKYSLEE